MTSEGVLYPVRDLNLLSHIFYPWPDQGKSLLKAYINPADYPRNLTKFSRI